MTSKDVRQKYLDFFKARKHIEIKPARIVPDDQTTLFTSSGMQQLIPYLMGESHPSGVRLVNSQPCFRAEDIEEVGDNRHTTFFEMLGNWSLGDYFKKEQIPWLFEFLTKELELDSKRLHVTVFEGNSLIPKDEETYSLWRQLGILEEQIYFFGTDKNWWSRSGSPDQMPVGEIGGTDSEVFYEFPEVEHDQKYGEKCYPHCNCGHFLEIGNSVFIEYKKIDDNEFEKLPQKNVDFGGGLERLTAATNNEPEIFKIDIFSDLRRKLIEKVDLKFTNVREQRVRIFLDHSRALIFLIDNGVIPGNNRQESVLRRLIRRADDQLHILNLDHEFFWKEAVNYYGKIYSGVYDIEINKVLTIILNELRTYGTVFKNLEKEKEKLLEIKTIYTPISTASAYAGPVVFYYQSTHGIPGTASEQLVREVGLNSDITMDSFKKEMEKHKELSRNTSVGMFKGGLAGHSDIEIKYHTATHLLHQALRDILGPEVFQKGSNINEERLRFDFSFDRKLTGEEVKKVEDLVNQKIKEDLKVDRKFMSVKDAKKLNAIGLFDEKYGKEVSVYCIGPDYTLNPKAKDQRPRANYYSVEFCGGPHVEHTGVIGEIKINKEEAISSGIRRIYAELV